MFASSSRRSVPASVRDVTCLRSMAAGRKTRSRWMGPVGSSCGRCEVSLTCEQMPPLEEEDPRIAFLVPWSSEIPIDLAGRFSQNGKVQRIGREARLRRMFGAVRLEEGVLAVAPGRPPVLSGPGSSTRPRRACSPRRRCGRRG